MSEVKLEPGWLNRQMDAITPEIAYTYSPQVAWGYGMTNIAAPLSDEDAGRLRDRMMRRYFDWTGRSLESDLAADRRT